MNTALGPKSIALSTNRVMLTDDPPRLILKLVGEVKFTEWTSESEMRHPVFLGLRTDKRHSTSSANKHEINFSGANAARSSWIH